MSQPPLALTCGDPAGVGAEVIEQWLVQHPEAHGDVCVVGWHKWVNDVRSLVSSDLAVEAVGDESFEPIAGHPNEAGAQLAFAALEAAAQGCREGRYRGVVTAPVSKTWMQKAGFDFPGQTEFFASRWEGEPTMAFAGGKLAVVLATWHIPLMQVADALTDEVLSRAVQRAAFLANKLGANEPRIGVCGLNPHAGEDGLLGTEEREHLDPILDKLRERFPGLSKTLPGDTVFWRQLQGDFDTVVALYHDQGLAPVKTLEFDASVNITLGLPWIRTSPDHGTAFGIAGQGKANSASFGNAVAMAMRLA